MPRLAQSILETLERHGVDTVFGIPGNHNIELYRYLPASKIRHVTAHHEQGVGFMADGYARASGKPGVCFLVSGPGVTNALTAMAQALADSVPMLVIATVGDQSRREGRLHELPDQLAVASGVCIEAVQSDTPASALAWIDQALEAHRHARPGPRFIQIPLSWWQLEAEVSAPAEPAERVLDTVELERARDLLEEAQRPLLLIGGGARDAGAEVAAFANLLGAPVVNTVNAKGVLPLDHPLSVTSSPSMPVVRQLLSAADVIVAVGTELGETDYDLLMSGPINWHAPILRIDIDAVQAQMNVASTAALIGDAAEVLAALLTLLPDMRREVWADLAVVRSDIVQHEHMHPQFAELFATIDRVCPHAVVVGDSTRPTYYAAWMWERPASRKYWHSASGYGTLGYALSAAIGAQLSVNAPVIAIIGDGGLLFTLGELAVAVREQLPVKILLWDNCGFQEIAHSMAAQGIDTATTQYLSPDFAAIGAGFGAEVSAPKNLDELATALAQPVSGPHLIHMREHLFITQPSGEWY